MFCVCLHTYMRRREGERSGERWGEGREIDWFFQESPSVTKIIWNALPIQGPGTKSIFPLTRLLVNHRSSAGTLGCPVGTQNWTCLKPSLSSHSTNYSSSCIPCLAHETTNHWRPCPGPPPIGFLQPHPSQRGKELIGPRGRAHPAPILTPFYTSLLVLGILKFPVQMPASSLFLGPVWAPSPGGLPGGRQHCQRV